MRTWEYDPKDAEILTIVGGGRHAFNDLAFPPNTQADLDFFAQQRQKAIDTAQYMPAHIGQQWIENINHMWHQAHNPTDIFRAQNAIRAAQQLQPNNQVIEQTYDRIQPLRTQEEIATASPLMQRYIMTHPKLAERYKAQTIDGYSDSYVNFEPEVIGEQNYDYRRVHDGMIQFDGDIYGLDGRTPHDENNVKTDEDYENVNWVVHIYPDEIFEGDRDLTLQEKIDIYDTTEVAVYYLDNDVDPTDIIHYSTPPTIH